MIDKDDIARVRQVHIATLLGIKNTGRRITIRCPFDDHNEKTGSFVIYPDGDWFCYGCAKSGQNSIDLLMAMGATFSESIEELKKYL